jgi:hypothetical protein
MSEGFHADKTTIEGTLEDEAKQDISRVLQPLFDEAAVSAHHIELEDLHIVGNHIEAELRPTPRFAQEEK